MSSSNAPTSADFDCEFNAPQFFDFAKMNEGADDNETFDEDIGEAEKYFEVDHESERKKKAQEEAKVSTGSAASSSTATENPSSPSVRELMRQKEDTPSRKRLREKVQKTVESVQNSPKMEVPPIRRSAANMGATPTAAAVSVSSSSSPSKSKLQGASSGSGVKKQTAQSPAVQKWKSIVRTMTPELIRKAMAARKNATAAGTRAPGTSSAATEALQKQENENIKKSFKAQMATAHRLAAQTTNASRARAVVATTKPAAPMKPSAATTEIATKLTRPEPFSFATTARPKAGPASGPMRAEEAVDFSKMLRNFNAANPTSGSTASRPTVVKPFNLSASNRVNRRRSRSVEPTPSRLRGARTSPYDAQHRARRTERGRSPNQGPPPPPRPPRGPSPTPSMASTASSCTEPQPFSFVDRDLAKVREKVSSAAASGGPMRLTAQAELDYTKMLRNFKSTNPAEPKATVVRPFNLTMSNRGRRSRSVEPSPSRRRDPSPSSHVIKAKAAPHMGVPNLLPSVEQRHATQPDPFSFHERDRQMFARKAEKIERVMEAEKKEREFKANPMPDISRTVGIPSKEPAGPTQAKPFNLEIERRVEARINKWQDDIKEELRRQREGALFKARPAAVLERAPFVPLPSDKPLCEIDNVQLHSDRRAEEREVYEMGKKHREAEQEGLKRQLEDRRHREEEDEIRRLRAEAVHRPEPIRQYKPVEVQPSGKPVTAPVSPKFSALHATRKHVQQTSEPK